MRTTVIIFLLTLSQMIGCAKPTATALNTSLQEYNKKEWLSSENWARKAINSGNDIGKAQYIMGLCEFQLQQVDSSKAWFERAALSLDPEVRGKATAMLGIIASSKGEYAAAQIAFQNASPNLRGMDKRRAAAKLRTLNTSNTFTLQFGAYRKKDNAIKSIEIISTSIRKAGLGTAWISEEKSGLGATIYLVQAGHFASRNDASSRRTQHQLPQCVVTKVATTSP